MICEHEIHIFFPDILLVVFQVKRFESGESEQMEHFECCQTKNER